MRNPVKALKLLCISAIVAGAFMASASATCLGVGTVNSSALRLRESNDISSQVISTATVGEQVIVLEQVGEWYKVNYNLQEGYMNTEYLDIETTVSKKLGYGQVATSFVNVRQDPNTNSTIMNQLSEGVIIKIIGVDNGWYEVETEFSDVSGYILSDYIDIVSAPAGGVSKSSSSSPSSSSGGVDYSSAPSSSSSSSSTSTSTSSSSSSSESSDTTPVSNATTLGQSIVSYAQQLSGIKYVYGGTSTNGFDCSGYVQYVYRQFGYSLNRTAAQQLQNGTSVSKSDLVAGDLVFFKATSEAASHVGIYIGNGQFIHASSAGGQVQTNNLSDSYYAKFYTGARRII